LIFAYGLALVRIAGRRVFERWTALDIIVAMVVGSSLSRVMTGSAALGGTLAAMILLMALHWLLARAAVCWAWASRLLEGVPVVLARGGKAEAEALRQNGPEAVSGSRLIMLEPSGKITVLKP